MLSLAALRLRRVQSAYALLQAKQRLIDLGSLDLTVLVVALAVLGTFGASQVNEQQFTARIDALLLDFNLSDGVTAGRSVVGLGGVRCTHLVTLLDELEDRVVGIDKLLAQASDLNRAVLVFTLFELLVLVQKIIKFAAVDFIHTDRYGEIPTVILPVINAALKQIFDCDVLNTVHCICLARAGLPVSKDGNNTLVEDQVKNRSDLEEVKFFVAVVLVERIVKLEICVFDRFGHTVHFIAAIVDYNFGITNTDNINLAVGEFVVEDGPLLEANGDLHAVCEGVMLWLQELEPLLLDHCLEVNVHFDSLHFVVSLTL